MAEKTPKAPIEEIIDMRDTPKEAPIEVGNIVAVQFKVVAIDGYHFVLEPLVTGEHGLPGRVAVPTTEVVFVADAE